MHGISDGFAYGNTCWCDSTWREAREVSERFGDRYRDYRARTPAFIPAWSSLLRHAPALETRG